MRFLKKIFVYISVLAVMWAAPEIYAEAAPLESEYVHGTVAVQGPDSSDTLTMDAGSHVEITVLPYVHVQYQGCGKPGCPAVCSGYGYECFVEGKGCTCSGDETTVQYADVKVHSDNEQVAGSDGTVRAEGTVNGKEAGNKNNGSLTLTAREAGEAHVTVTAALKDWTPVSRTFTVKVGGTTAPPEQPGGTPAQPETPSEQPGETPAPSETPPEQPGKTEPAAEPPVLENTTAVMNGSGKVTFALTDYSALWAGKVSAVYVDQTELKAQDYSIDENGLTISTGAFTKGKRAAYDIRIAASGYLEVSASVTVNNFAAERFYVRLLDKNGKVKKTETYTKDEMIRMSGTQDVCYQTVCGMRGITSYKARGIYLEDLLKKSGITFGPGMTLKLRTNDMAKSGNDPEQEDAYYDRGVFSYEDLMGNSRYWFPDIYTKSELQDQLLAADKFNSNMRTILGSSRKEEVRPMIAYTHTESIWRNEPDNDLSGSDYRSSAVSERAFKFLFGIAMDKEQPNMISGTVTTWSAAYCVFGLDIVEGDVSVPAAVKLKSAVSADYRSIKITWNKGENASGYIIYRADGKNKNYKSIQTIRSGEILSYTDRGLTTGKTYYYKVRAVQNTGNISTQGVLSPAKSAVPMPGKVTIRSARRSTAKKAVIQWKKAAGASGYIISRSDSKNGNYKTVKRITSGKQLKYSDTGLKKNKTYFYKIQAYRTVNGKRKAGACSAAWKVKAAK